MNKTILFLLPALLLLAGCAREYVITTDNGQHISCKGRPHLVGGFYVYKDAFGQTGKVKAIVVREVAPRSMMTEQGEQFKPVHSQ